MCDGMKIAKRLMLIGVILIVLSMTMATQYVTTRITYRYNLVHPSEADVRFIGSDFSSDNIRILRISGTNASGSMNLELRIGGNLSAGQNKTYTAVFGIVNEEDYAINITHFQVDHISGEDYMQIWLHGNMSRLKETDGTAVKVWDKGTIGDTNASSVWVLGPGNHNSQDMSADGVAQLATPWDDTAHVRYYSEDDDDATSGTSDFVWVQISIDAPADADTSTSYTGTIWVFTRTG